MSHVVLARKYRPSAFDAVVGQDAISRTLRNAIVQSRVAHAYMFCGPRGVGKTSMARIFARALNCMGPAGSPTAGPTVDPCGVCDVCVRVATGDDLDVLEIDAASNRKVDDARTIIANVSFHPTRARFKIYIVDEVHMLTTEAFNALLKTLEEPPPHVKFVFATTDPQKVPATILSRCQRFDFRSIPTADLVRLLTDICAKEGLDAEPAAISAISRAALGGARDAESLLEQLATMGGGKVRVADLHALLGTVPAERMRSLFDAVSSGDVRTVLVRAGETLDLGTDPGELLRQCMRHVHDLLVVRTLGAQAADVEADPAGREALAEQAERFSEATLVYAVTVLSEALRSVKLLGEGRLFAETALAKLAGHRDMRFLDQMVRELHALEKRIGAAAPAGAISTSPTHPVASQGSAPRAMPPPGLSRSSPPPGDARVPAPPPSATSATPREISDVAEDAPTGDFDAVAAADSFVGDDAAPEIAGPVAAAVTATETSAVAQAIASVALDLDGIRARWGSVSEAVARQGLLRAALTAAEIVDFEGGTLSLGFAAGAGIHRQNVSSGPTGERLQQVLREVYGVPIRVATLERSTPDARAADPEGERDRRAQSRDRLSSADLALIETSTVAKLVEKTFGAASIIARYREDPDVIRQPEP